MTPPFSGHTQASHCWWVEIYFPITSYKMSKTSGMITISQQHSHLEMVFLCPMMTSRWAASGSWILGFHQAMLQKDGWLPNEKCRKTSHFSCRDDYQLFSYFKNSWGLLSLLFSKKAGFWPPFGPHFLTPKFAKDLLWHWLLWRPPPDHGVPRRSSAWSPTSRGVSFIKWFDLNGWTNVPGMNEPLSIDNYLKNTLMTIIHNNSALNLNFRFWKLKVATKPHRQRLPCWPWHDWASRTWPARQILPPVWTSDVPVGLTISLNKKFWKFSNRFFFAYFAISMLSLCPCALFLLLRNSKWFSAVYLSVVQIYLSQK